jgi:hypothetical protein
MAHFVVKVSDLTLARTEVVEVLHISASLTSTQDSFFFRFLPNSGVVSEHCFSNPRKETNSSGVCIFCIVLVN